MSRSVCGCGISCILEANGDVCQRCSTRSGNGSHNVSHSAGNNQESGLREDASGCGCGRSGRIVGGAIAINVTAAVCAHGLGHKDVRRGEVGCIHGTVHHHHQVLAVHIEEGLGQGNGDGVCPGGIIHCAIEDLSELSGRNPIGAEVFCGSGSQPDLGGFAGKVGSEVVVELDTGDLPHKAAQFGIGEDSLKEAVFVEHIQRNAGSGTTFTDCERHHSGRVDQEVQGRCLVVCGVGIAGQDYFSVDGQSALSGGNPLNCHGDNLSGIDGRAGHRAELGAISAEELHLIVVLGYGSPVLNVHDVAGAHPLSGSGITGDGLGTQIVRGNLFYGNCIDVESTAGAAQAMLEADESSCSGISGEGDHIFSPDRGEAQHLNLCVGCCIGRITHHAYGEGIAVGGRSAPELESGGVYRQSGGQRRSNQDCCGCGVCAVCHTCCIGCRLRCGGIGLHQSGGSGLHQLAPLNGQGRSSHIIKAVAIGQSCDGSIQSNTCDGYCVCGAGFSLVSGSQIDGAAGAQIVHNGDDGGVGAGCSGSVGNAQNEALTCVQVGGYGGLGGHCIEGRARNAHAVDTQSSTTHIHDGDVTDVAASQQDCAIIHT